MTYSERLRRYLTWRGMNEDQVGQWMVLGAAWDLGLMSEAQVCEVLRITDPATLDAALLAVAADVWLAQQAVRP